MSSRRAKLTVDKARERVTSLEESIVVREQKLEHLLARLERVAHPEEKLLEARKRLERRIALEREQVLKLKRLLARREDDQRQDSGEYFGAEEIENLHQSFEEVRQDLSQVKMRLENTDIPRDLPSRLSSFEERIGRREEADSDLFTQILALQTALDQECQTVRRLSRRIREQDQNLDALREAVEDSVVATVDLAERLDELEEHYSTAPASSQPSEQLSAFQQDIHSKVEELANKWEADLRGLEEREGHQPGASEPSEELDRVQRALELFDGRLNGIEARLHAQSSEKREPQAPWVPAKFSASNQGRLVATFARGTPERLK